MTPEEKKIANRTCRSASWSSKALVPRLVRDILDSKNKGRGVRVLDYGAGKQALHTKMLRAAGYNVTAHDMGDNFDPQYHDELALQRRYMLVYASNVLNTLASVEAVRETIKEIRSAVTERGCAVVNYPDSPRKCDISTAEMEHMLRDAFGDVYKSGKYGKPNRPVWVCWP